MNIGIIGSGMIGGAAAQLFVRAGHAVAISNSRGPASLASLVEDLGSKARAATIEGATSFGEIVLVAIPFGKYQTLPGKLLEGKVVVDAMNYYPQRDGRIELDDLTSTRACGQTPARRSPHQGRQQPGSPIYNRPMTAREAQTVPGSGARRTDRG